MTSLASPDSWPSPAKIAEALRQGLTGLGLARNTVLIFISDHGIMQGECGLGGKALKFDGTVSELLEVP